MDAFKKSIILKGIVSIFPLAIFSGLLFYTIGLYRDSAAKRNVLLNGIFEIRTRISDLHDREAVLAANLGLYKKVLFLRIKQDSYMNDIQKTVNSLAKTHMLIHPKIQISAPMAAKFDSYKEGDSLSSVKGTVAIDFFSISDINVFSFVNAVRNRIPGYVLIKELKLARKGNLDTKIILDYANQDVPEIVVQGSVSFEWYGLESIGEEH